MTNYQVVLARSARKELEALEADIVSRIIRDIEALGKNPRPKGCKKLKGKKNLWRIRIGDYRVIYDIHDDRKLVDISIVRHQSQAYE
jgi:mRNA interferase RelE/StbE